MEHFLEQIAAISLSAKLIYSILGIVLIRSVFRQLERTLPLRYGDGNRRYHVRKMVTTVCYIIIFAFIAIFFADRIKRFGFALGLFAAAFVVALQDAIASFAGFLGIVFSSLYRVGDRIQINEIKGDVIDISMMRTTLMETGNWVSGDLYNGRIVRIPNNAVLKGMVFNYSQGFRFVWDEIKIRLTAASDHRHARQMLLRVAGETVSEYLAEAQGSWKQIVENYRVENPLLEPVVAIHAAGGSLEFSLSYIVDYTKRTIVKDHLLTRIVDEVANSNGMLEWASATVMLQSPSGESRATANLASATSGSGQ